MAAETLVELLADAQPVGQLRIARRAASAATIASSLGDITLGSFNAGTLRLQLGRQQGFDYQLVTGQPSPEPLHGGDTLLDWGALTATVAPEGIAIHADGQPLLRPPQQRHFTGRLRWPQLGIGPDGRISCAFDLHDGERLYGLGEKWSSLDLRGQLIDSSNLDSLGGDGESSYKNVPWLWSTAGWGLLFNTPARVRHALGYAPISQRSYIAMVDDALDLFIVQAATPQQLLDRFHALCGRPGAIPDWTLGAWLSKAYYADQAELMATARAVRDNDKPIDTIVLDGRTWQDTKTRFYFEWDQSRYPDPAATVRELHELGFKVCAWLYPICSVHNRQFAELERQGVFLKDAAGRTLVYSFDDEPFGEVLTRLPDSALVDFTAPAGRDWWIAGCRQLLELGVDAFKTDFGEQVPDTAVASNGDSGARLHNVYAMLYNQATWQAFAGSGKQPALWGRAAWTGSHRYPTQWCGDVQSDYDGLRSAIRGQLAWMLSGAAYTSSDIGGFFGEQPSASLYIRWLQHGALSALMRMHGIGDRAPWQFGPAAQEICRQWLLLRETLKPYLRRTARQATQGVPMMRPMPLAYPEQSTRLHGCDLQYMLGDDLFCAPVCDDRQAEFWLPPGRWYDFFHKRFTRGGRWIRRSWPLAHAPLFVRAGSLVELADHGCDRTARLLVCGLPEPGEHPCGVTVVQLGEGVQLTVPEAYELDCRGCTATAAGDGQWLVSQA